MNGRALGLYRPGGFDLGFEAEDYGLDVDKLDIVPTENLGPAIAVCLGILGAALGANVALIRNGFAPITAVARTPAGRAVVSYIKAHFDAQLGPFDVFTHAARMIPRRSP